MKKFISHLKGIRKLGILLVSLFMLGPIAYAIACIKKDAFHFISLIEVTGSALGFGAGLFCVIALINFIQTEGLLKALRKIELSKIGDGNVLLIDAYNGWERIIELKGTVNGRTLWIYHDFKKAWIRMIPYLYITIDPDETMERTEIRVDRHLTADTISKGVDDTLLLL